LKCIVSPLLIGKKLFFSEVCQLMHSDIQEWVSAEVIGQISLFLFTVITRIIQPRSFTRIQNICLPGLASKPTSTNFDPMFLDRPDIKYVSSFLVAWGSCWKSDQKIHLFASFLHFKLWLAWHSVKIVFFRASSCAPIVMDFSMSVSVFAIKQFVSKSLATFTQQPLYCTNACLLCVADFHVWFFGPQCFTHESNAPLYTKI